MHPAIQSIDEYSDLEVIMYYQTEDKRNCFYLLEQSSMQILRELSPNTPLLVTDISSERARIQNKVNQILATRSIDEFFKITIPLIENGSFPCKDITIIINDQIEIYSHDDGEVNLKFKPDYDYHYLMDKVLARQGYNSKILQDVIELPNAYQKLIRPDKIGKSYKSFDELIDEI
jgi:hypothetical protein